MTPPRRNDDDLDRLLLQELQRLENPSVADDEEEWQNSPDSFAMESSEEEEEDLAAFSTALHSYREQTLHWAQQRSASMPPPVVPRRAAWLHAPQWALGTAAFCACVIGGALYTHHQAALVQQSAAALPPAPTQQLLAADNQLLLSVDDALQGEAAPTEQELGLAGELGGQRAPKRHGLPQQTN